MNERHATLAVEGLRKVLLSGSNLTCSFKEAGLESGSVETIICTATATTTYECVNGSGHNPLASNKTTTVSQASSPPAAFTATKNGNIQGTTNPTRRQRPRNSVSAVRAGRR